MRQHPQDQDTNFSWLKNFASGFQLRFPLLRPTAPKNSVTAELTMSEAVLNWYLVPVVEEWDDEDGLLTSRVIQQLIKNALQHANNSNKISFEFTRSAIGGLKETTQPLKLIFKEREVLEDYRKKVICYAVYFDDETETEDTIQVATV